MALANLPIRYVYLSIFVFLGLFVLWAPSPAITSASFGLFGESEPPTLEALAKKRANKDNEVVLYFANSGFIGHLVNSVCSLRAEGNEHFVIAAVDAEMMDICKSLNLPCAPSVLGFQNDTAAMDFQSEGYYHVVQSKTAQVEALLRTGLHVVFCDSDVYHLQDPLKTDLPCRDDTCHIAMSTNRPDVPPAWQWGNWNFNSGFYYVRSSEEMIQEWSVIREAIRESGELEQPPFNTVLCGIDAGQKDWDTGLCVNDHQIKTAMLDPARFVIAASDRLSPEKVEPIWHWHTIPRDLVTIHLAWLAGEQPKMATWRKAGMIAYDTTTFECLPFDKEARVSRGSR